MFWQAMPGIVDKVIDESELRRRVEFLTGNMEAGHGDVRRKLFWPANRGIFYGHPEWIGLDLHENVELDVRLSEGLDHIFAKIIVRRVKRQARNLLIHFGFRIKCILHRLAFAEKIGHAAIIILAKRVILRLVPKSLHEE